MSRLGSSGVSNTVKWGILGYARIAHTQIIPAILRDKNSDLVALASRSEEKLGECRAAFRIPKLYGSYDALLADPEIQVVYIPLPNALHHEWTLKACAKGKHVLCEKPISLNRKECEEMIAAAKKHNVLLMEAFMYRYTDRIRKIQEILQSGVLGEIKYIHSSYRFFLDRVHTIKEVPELGGGSLFDVGCYPVNFIGMILQDAPVEYTAQAVLANGVDIIFSAVLKYGKGVIATIDSGFNAFADMTSRIIGTKGLMEIPDTFAGMAGTIRIRLKDEIIEVAIEESDRYGLEVAGFANLVLEHGEKPFSADELLHESLRNATVLENLQKTIKKIL
jgi:predicted dehydrogenase